MKEAAFLKVVSYIDERREFPNFHLNNYEDANYLMLHAAMNLGAESVAAEVNATLSARSHDPMNGTSLDRLRDNGRQAAEASDLAYRMSLGAFAASVDKIEFDTHDEKASLKKIQPAGTMLYYLVKALESVDKILAREDIRENYSFVARLLTLNIAGDSRTLMASPSPSVYQPSEKAILASVERGHQAEYGEDLHEPARHVLEEAAKLVFPSIA